MLHGNNWKLLWISSCWFIKSYPETAFWLHPQRADTAAVLKPQANISSIESVPSPLPGNFGDNMLPCSSHTKYEHHHHTISPFPVWQALFLMHKYKHLPLGAALLWTTRRWRKNLKNERYWHVAFKARVYSHSIYFSSRKFLLAKFWKTGFVKWILKH